MNQTLNINSEMMNKYLDKAIDLMMGYAPKFILALIVLVVGFSIIGQVLKLLEKSLNTKAVDPSLIQFLRSLIGALLKIALILAVIDMIGIKTTSFVAVLGAAGLAVGLALQGSLSNFAGGVLILLFRPFRTGDYIIAQGEEGTVQKIDIFNTWLNKLDNRRVILPNGPLASGTIINVTAEEVRRVDISVGVSYRADVDHVKKTLLDLAKEDSRILDDPEPFVGLIEMADSSVNFTFRVWCQGTDYWPVFYDTNEAVKKRLDCEGIEIPFPQRDVHIYQRNLDS